MVKITKVTTKKGDSGETSLAAGKKISKSCVEVEALGCLDELNAFLGFANESLKTKPNLLTNKLTRIQNELFDLGTRLAVSPADLRPNTPAITADDITRLETEITDMNRELPYLKSFILPSGGESSSRLHLARTICRRTERVIVAFAGDSKDYQNELKYINRLSDWLFVAARFVAAQQKIQEQLWEPGRREYEN